MPFSVDDIAVILSGKRVLDNVSLEAGPGELHVVMGPNGSGKTTLVKALTGLVPVARGRIVIDGVDVTQLPPAARGLGVVFQGAPLLPLGRVYDHIEFPLRARGVDKREARARVLEVADTLGLREKLYERLSRLSGGERQKVAIATALAAGSRNLVLDEPFSNLDPAYRLELYQVLHGLRREGYTIMATTHIVDEIVASADRLWILVDGRIVEEGKPGDLLGSPSTWYTRLLARIAGEQASPLSGLRPLQGAG